MDNTNIKAKATAVLVAGLVGAYGAWVVAWNANVRTFFAVGKIDCNPDRPCPTNWQKYRFTLEALTLAREVSVETGVPVSAIVAQTALETGFGTSYLWRTHNNGFGIKCSNGYTNCVSRYDREYVGGQATGWVSQFRRYSSAAHSFRDYADFLRVNRRYALAWNERRDGRRFVREVHRAGYATDPNYTAKLTRIIDALQLHRFDLQPEQWKLRPEFCRSSDRAAGWCAR